MFLMSPSFFSSCSDQSHIEFFLFQHLCSVLRCFSFFLLIEEKVLRRWQKAHRGSHFRSSFAMAGMPPFEAHQVYVLTLFTFKPLTWSASITLGSSFTYYMYHNQNAMPYLPIQNRCWRQKILANSVQCRCCLQVLQAHAQDIL